MKKNMVLVLVVLFLTTSVGLTYAKNLSDSFQYISPIPGSKLVSKETGIILRPGEILAIDNNIITSLARIEGSISGSHSYEALISDDQKTVILKPDNLFQPGEIVTVALEKRLTTITGQQSGTGSFSFTISPKRGRLLSESDWRAVYDEYYPAGSESSTGPDENLLIEKDASLPSDFPPIVVNVSDNPDTGNIFIANMGFDDNSRYLMILDNSGHPVFYKKVHAPALDFKRQPNGLLSYIYDYEIYFYVMDSTYTVIDSFRTIGYDTDKHDFQMLDNGHVLLMAYDPQTVDMSVIVPGGNPEATVIGLIIQELDVNKNVVFQWRSWDHFEITDATYTNFTYNTIDYVHGNTLELDYDGNLLTCCRNMDEFTNIDRHTGEIIWRLGGINNQFAVMDDFVGWSRPHDIRRLPNGNITIFDNGRLNTPQLSRAVEYELDEVNMICTQVWEYRHSPDVFGPFMGNAQRLPNGNTMIGWGGITFTTLTECRPNGSTAFELTLVNVPIAWTYRAFRFPWNGFAPAPYLIAEPYNERVRLVFSKFGDANVVKYYIYMGLEPEPTAIVDSTSDNYYDITGLFNDTTYYFRVTAIDDHANESPFSNEEEVVPFVNYLYISGDINGDGNIRGSDITYGFRYFIGIGPPPPDSMYNDLTDRWLYVAADVNGDCNFYGSDITFIIKYLRYFNDTLLYCPQTPPY